MVKLKYPTKFVGITQDFTTTHLANDLGWNNNYGGKNCDLYACGNGTVTSIRDGRNNTMVNGDSGNYVTIKYADGYKTRTCHMLKGSITVKPGDKVTSSTIIGKMGNSGYCRKDRAYHTHFIVWKNGVRVNPRKNVYVYDDNVLYFFKKDSSDPNNIKYIAVDWYGRIIDKKWKENRKNHNRRVCYEFARFYAKAINEMLIGNDNCEAFMLGDKENLHYVVGLTGNEYSIILDPDDFNNIKDLTRLKLGLTINGIKILRDNSGKFQKAVDKFNQDKKNELPEVEKTRENLKDGNFIEYFKSVVEILKSYNIDSQGFYEYMKSIVEQEEIETEKVWKKINGDNEKRYARCSIFNLDSKTYLLDSVDKTLSIINNENLDKDTFVFNPEENEYPYYGG